MSLESDKAIIASLKSLLKDSYVDVFALQEAKGLLPAGNDAIRDLFPEHYIAAHIETSVVPHTTNLITISKHTITKVMPINLPRLGGWLWTWLFKLVKSSVPQHKALLTVHLLPNRAKLTVINVHLDVFGGKSLKIKQALEIKKALELYGSEKVIVLGDFNTANLVLINELTSYIGEGFQVIGNPKEATVGIDNKMSSAIPFNKIIHLLLKKIGLAGLFKYRSDWMLVKNLNFVSETILREHIGSDHYPICVSFKE